MTYTRQERHKARGRIEHEAREERAVRPREIFMCPFCRTTFPPGAGWIEMCGGGFLDRDHPSAVRPILVEVNDDGSLREGEEERLAESRVTYRRSAGTTQERRY